MSCTQNPHKGQLETVLATGRKIFIDCGFNTCSVLREFINKYPDFEFYGFEAQKELAHHAEQIKKEFPHCIKDLQFKAASDKNGVANFYLAQYWGGNYRGGSTLMRNEGKKVSRIDYSNPVAVECVDFSDWLKNHFNRNDYIIVKMDVEGAEYAILSKMIRDDTIDFVNEFYIEFHTGKSRIRNILRRWFLIWEFRKRKIVLHPWR